MFRHLHSQCVSEQETVAISAVALIKANLCMLSVCRVFGQDSGRSDQYRQQEGASEDPAQEE